MMATKTEVENIPFKNSRHVAISRQFTKALPFDRNDEIDVDGKNLRLERIDIHN